MLLGLACVAGTADAQNQLLPLESVNIIRETFASEQWAKEFAYSFTPIVELEPKLEALERDLFAKEVQPLLQAENYQGAVTRLRSYVSGKPEASGALTFTIAALHQQLAYLTQENKAQSDEHMKQAIQFYQQAIKSFPNYLRAHKNLGQLLTQLERFNDALPHLQKAIELGDSSPSTLGLLGYIYSLQERWLPAEGVLRQALVLRPNDVNYRRLLGQALLAQSRWEEARAVFEDLLQENPENSELWEAIANTYLGANDLNNAAINLEALRALGKANTQSLMLLGNIYVNRQLLLLAAETFKQAVGQANTAALSPDSFIQAATTLSSYGIYSEAVEMIRLIEERFGDRLSSRDELQLLTLSSEINIALGKGEEAAQNLEQVLLRDPNNANALNALARYYAESVVGEGEGATAGPRNYERAVQLFQRAQDHEDAQARFRAFLGNAQLEVRRSNFKDAVPLLQSALSIRDEPSVREYLDQIQTALRSRTGRS